MSSRPDTRESGWESRDLSAIVREEIPDNGSAVSGMTLVVGVELQENDRSTRPLKMFWAIWRFWISLAPSVTWVMRAWLRAW